MSIIERALDKLEERLSPEPEPASKGKGKGQKPNLQEVAVPRVNGAPSSGVGAGVEAESAGEVALRPIGTESVESPTSAGPGPIEAPDGASERGTVPGPAQTLPGTAGAEGSAASAPASDAAAADAEPLARTPSSVEATAGTSSAQSPAPSPQSLQAVARANGAAEQAAVNAPDSLVPLPPPGRKAGAEDGHAAGEPWIGPRLDDVAEERVYMELDLARLERAGFVTPNNADGEMGEQFRIIKRPLIMKAAAAMAAGTPNANLLLVTSSVPSEGKTFTAINLAMSVAMELDRTVLLVDADAHRSDVTKLLDMGQRRGLTEHLLDEEPDLSKLLVRTNVDRLVILPSGRRVDNVTELFASQDMERLGAELASRYPDRIVLFDSPPLLATSEANVLAHLVGQVVMVVEAVRTPQSAIREALDRLAGCENVGLVLNKVRQRRGGYGYGYGYGYGNYRGAKSDKAS